MGGKAAATRSHWLRLSAPDARLTFAHVYGSDWMLGRGGAAALPLEHLESDRLLAEEKWAAGIEADLVSCTQTPVARGLHELAEQRGADLLVVGSSRHAVLGRALMGDDARVAFDGSPCAIAIAPRGYTHVRHQLHKIGVATTTRRKASTRSHPRAKAQLDTTPTSKRFGLCPSCM